MSRSKRNGEGPALKGVPRKVEPGGIVIVGAGLAGLFTALKLAPLPVTVVSVTPFGLGGSSVWAQAGIAAALSEGDSPEAHAADTVRAGAGIVDQDIARLLAGEARSRIEDLLRYGVPFDKDLEGHLDLAQEAAHGARRILHVKGDTAGEVLRYMQYDVERLFPQFARDCERAVREGRMTLAESQALRRFYEWELNGYTYLEG